MADDYDPADNSRKCYDLAIAEIRKQCLRPDGSFDMAKADRMVNGERIRDCVLHRGDCLDVLAGMDADSVDSCVTDPPYGLAFMGKNWDHGVPGIAFWQAVYRVLKPGAHLVAFGGTRTYHRLACAIEDAGFEIRDQLAWIYGSGFPKSHNQGNGWGTALKPAWEPIVLARKPLSEKTVAANVLRWGTGAINVDGCRIESEGGRKRQGEASQDRRYTENGSTNFAATPGPRGGSPSGRWPANLCHDGSEEVLAGFPESKSTGGDGYKNSMFFAAAKPTGGHGLGDSDSAARFFYCAKASKAERAGSEHPTVKPVALMQWLCRLITPPGGVVLDPFAGTGTTGEAALAEGFRAVLIEREAEYQADIVRRLSAAPPRQETLDYGEGRG